MSIKISQPENKATIANENPIENIFSVMNGGEYKELPIYTIDYSPFNYRKKFSENDLETFATELKQHGIISPLTVRLMPSGNYELVAGERRLRAATKAGIVIVPVVVKEYNDEQVREIQLAENLQRENPHPLHEAFAIGHMQDAGKKIDEIAVRLGKSKQFIYTRIKLLVLIDAIQQMFLNDIINLQEAVEIARISTEGQTEFYQTYCKDWKKRKEFHINNLENKLDQFKYDLKEAPFNTKDKNLLPEAGACNTCESNTATLKILFPEFARQAICNNRECYNKKCGAHFNIQLANAIAEHDPAALIFNGDPSELVTGLVQSMKEAANLPTYSRYDIDIINPPEMPEAEDYTEEEDNDGEEASVFNEKRFNEAMEEYEEEMGEYKTLLDCGKVQKGLLVMENDIRLLAFNPEKQKRSSSVQQNSAKDIQAAIKSGTVTAEMLEAEIERLNTKEKRAKQLDREKIQLTVHEKFTCEIESVSNIKSLTHADQVAARLLVFQSLNYYTRAKVDAALFSSADKEQTYDSQDLFTMFAALTEQQYSYLIRSAMACQADSKFPLNTTGYFLYKQAENAGLNVEAIEQSQDEKAATREAKLIERKKELEKQIGKLKTK